MKVRIVVNGNEFWDAMDRAAQSVAQFASDLDKLQQEES